MLARFKSFKLKKYTIALFVISALALGVGGNGVYDLLKWTLSYAAESRSEYSSEGSSGQPNEPRQGIMTGSQPPAKEISK